MQVMSLIEVDDGRWRLDFGEGLGLELVLLFSRTVAFWRLGGQVVADIDVGQA